MTVTIGARGVAVASDFSPAAAISRLSSTSLALVVLTVWPISWTASVAVSWSSDWLMVAMTPMPISTLMTSVALTAMRLASSPTMMNSGTSISRTTGAVGCWNA